MARCRQSCTNNPHPTPHATSLCPLTLAKECGEPTCPNWSRELRKVPRRKLGIAHSQTAPCLTYLIEDPTTRSHCHTLLANTVKMGRVRTKTVKKSAKVIIERYYPKLTLDFETNKRICDEIAIIASKRLRNKVCRLPAPPDTTPY